MEDIKVILDSVPEPRYVLDYGNYFCIKQNVVAAYDLLKSKTVHMHAMDWIYSPYGDFASSDIPRYNVAPLGKGAVPLDKIAEKAKAYDYKGSAVVEINSPVSWSEFDESIEYLGNEFGI